MRSNRKANKGAEAVWLLPLASDRQTMLRIMKAQRTEINSRTKGRCARVGIPKITWTTTSLQRSALRGVARDATSSSLRPYQRSVTAFVNPNTLGHIAVASINSRCYYALVQLKGSWSHDGGANTIVPRRLRRSEKDLRQNAERESTWVTHWQG